MKEERKEGRKEGPPLWEKSVRFRLKLKSQNTTSTIIVLPILKDEINNKYNTVMENHDDKQKRKRVGATPLGRTINAPFAIWKRWHMGRINVLSF